MNIKSILIMLMLIASIGVVSADTVQVVKTQYPAFIAQFGIGEVLYKTVTDNGDVSYQLSRNGFKPLTIFAGTTYYQIEQGSSVIIPITINGCCQVMDGQYSHEHTLYVFDDVTGKLVLQNYPVDVGSHETGKKTSVTLTPPNAVGLYKYNIREKIGLNTVSDGYILATGNLISVSIQVGTPVATYTTPQPTYTTPQPTYTTPQPTYTTQPTATGTPPPSGDCVFGSFMINGKCAKVIPTPGFGIMFAVMGIIGVFLLTRRK